MGTICISLPGLLDRVLPAKIVQVGPVLLMRQSIAQREREHQSAMTSAAAALRQLNPFPAAPAVGSEAGREAGDVPVVSSSLSSN